MCKNIRNIYFSHSLFNELSILNQGQEKQHLCTPLHQHLFRTLSQKIVHQETLKVVRVITHLRQEKEEKKAKTGAGQVAVIMYILEMIFQNLSLMRGSVSGNILLAPESK